MDKYINFVKNEFKSIREDLCLSSIDSIINQISVGSNATKLSGDDISYLFSQHKSEVEINKEFTKVREELNINHFSI